MAKIYTQFRDEYEARNLIGTARTRRGIERHVRAASKASGGWHPVVQMTSAELALLESLGRIAWAGTSTGTVEGNDGLSYWLELTE